MGEKMKETFKVTVPEIGDFVFKRRNMRLGCAIMCEEARILGAGDAPIDETTRLLVRAFASLKVQTVQAPEGWNLDEMDPDDTVSYRRLVEVWTTLRTAEDAAKGGKPVKAPAAVADAVAAAVEAPTNV
jgi:hypothetical protein